MGKKRKNKDFEKFKANQEKESKGLGDTIAKVTKATGIKNIVKFIAGEDCGCDARQKALNEVPAFKYNRPKCLIEEEYVALNKYFSEKKNSVTADEQKSLLLVYNRIFSKTNQFSSCPPCVNTMVTELRQVYEKYNNN